MSANGIAKRTKHSRSLERGAVMRENSEEWMQISEQAASEQDPEQLMTLVEQISVLLEAREQRLKGKDPRFDLPPKFPREAGPHPPTDLASGTIGGRPAYGDVLHN